MAHKRKGLYMERTDRIEEEIKKVASKSISQELKDPRLTGLISVTKVSVTKDLKYCKVFRYNLVPTSRCGSWYGYKSGGTGTGWFNNCKYNLVRSFDLRNRWSCAYKNVTS